ncbi:phosphinothricin acetyltransferase (plasmid) [Deinococcus aetherius]|uniref:Phosphinothricin acetyltransferase n=1 Tax=Deinococcus aetherius TaxID=200252 RepID=A0ABN6RPH1_9DEIO|nr:GNAT family N-acetyltransferase [Deinococcus aetherius]BDP43661.1 phosphinothricin acetyltransferase [Deinococcus aetherius]
MTCPAVRSIGVTPDLPTILDIYNEAVLNTTASYDYEPTNLEARLGWFDAKMEQGLPVFVAQDQGTVVGWGSYGPFRAWPGYLYTVEHSVYVAADQRGKGIGRRLLPPLIEHARAKGLHAMIAGIDADNAASLRLHEGLGFVKVAHFRQVGWKFDRWLDLVFLELLLDDGDRTPARP